MSKGAALCVLTGAQLLLHFVIVMFAVAAVFDVVSSWALLLTQQTCHLGTGDVESLPAALPVAGHAGSAGRLALPPVVLADIAGLKISLMGDILQDDGLHGENVGKLHLRDVQCTDNVGPPSTVGPLEGTIFVGAQLTPHTGRPLL